MATNVFEDDWRECLRAHYAHVIRERDSNNERSLITVLKQTGFTEDEITDMRTQTLIVLGWYSPDQADVPSDALADSVDNAISAAELPVEVMEAAPEAPAPEPQAEPVDEAKTAEPPETPPQEPPKPLPKPPSEKPPEQPKQMSLF